MELSHPWSGAGLSASWSSCGFYSMEAFCTYSEDQSKDGPAQISGTELKDCSSPSSTNPLGQFSLLCVPNFSSFYGACPLHPSWRESHGPTSITVLCDLVTKSGFAGSHACTLLHCSWIMAGRHPIVLSRVLERTESCYQVWAQLFCPSQGW